MNTTTSSASRRRAYQGPVILSFGFRPFFLLGPMYAGLAILVWLPVFRGELSLHSAFAPRDWHVHEMLYGYLPAVMTGFLFTAIPNWTGRLPIQGKPLLTLALVWIAGRIAVTISADTGWHRLLLVLTDGKPNDIDHYEGRFGVEDTRRAIQDARRNGVRVFGITIDARAQNFFPTLFGRGGYAIISNPTRLPALMPLLLKHIMLD